LTAKKLGENIYPVDAEIGAPLWQLADRHFATNKKGIIMNVAGKLVYKKWDGAVEKIHTPSFTSFKCLALHDNDCAFAIAAGPSSSSSVIRINLETKKVDVLRESWRSSELERCDISIPESLHFQSDGTDVQAWFYPPFSTKYKAPEGTLPPVVLLAHGGPTAYSPGTLDMRIQYFTTRGFAVCDVNYRGSSGFGTVYRNMIRRNWGIVDRDDMINAAKHLLCEKRVDPKRLCIMGCSAGGYLLLATLLKTDMFAAAASVYGVSDLVGLAQDTHKFEFGYNEQLIGKFPEEKAVYEERSPLNQCYKLYTPVAFFHGEIDTVVPVSQSEELHEALKKKGVPTSLIVFGGEGHGFRGSHANKETINGIYCFFCRILGIEPSEKSGIKIENEARVEASTKTDAMLSGDDKA
uniref:Peptidase_S9 domain-containing protein n=1 Tax=Gongylonema pulchrum TaxID=637853 RepID=A0A183CXH0_9BILA